MTIAIFMIWYQSNLWIRLIFTSSYRWIKSKQ